MVSGAPLEEERGQTLLSLQKKLQYFLSANDYKTEMTNQQKTRDVQLNHHKQQTH
jgi:hypothetical protein